MVDANKIVYFKNLTKEEKKILNILEQYDKQHKDRTSVDFLFLIKKGSYTKPDDPIFYTWETDDFLFGEGDSNVVAYLINKQPKYSTIVEMGVWKGWSTSNIIPKIEKKYRKYFCIDWFKGSPTESCEGANPEQVKELFWKRMKEKGLDKKIELIEGDSVEVSKLFEDGIIDVFFLDGAHTNPYFINDVLAWRDKIKTGGIFSGHDWSEVGPTAEQLFTQEKGYEKIKLPEDIFGKHDCWAYKKIR